MKRYLYFLLIISNFSLLLASPLHNTCGEYDYVVPSTQTQEEAKRIAVEKARIDALQNRYGSNIIQLSAHTTSISQQVSVNSQFASFASTSTNGEWVRDTQPPTLTFHFDPQTGEQTIHVKVCGQTREIQRNRIDLYVQPLLRKDHVTFPTDRFHHGDDFSIAFRAPVNGYLTIWLIDEDNNAIRILPIFQIQAGNDYQLIDNLKFIASKSIEYNMLCLVFSPNSFTPANAPIVGDFAMMPFADFQKWYARLLQTDNDLQLISTLIAIEQ